MAEVKDYSKLKRFVEAAITNPKHPVYQLGMQHSPILQHYAVNVSTLKTIEAEQWFKDYPNYTEKLEAVMALCEATDEPASDTSAESYEVTQLRDENTKLKARVAELEKPEAEDAEA